MSLASEFRAFVARGNVVDLAVAVVVGAAFGKIVTSLVNDIVMPPIGLLMGGIDFSDLRIPLRAANAAKGLPAVSINYGTFITTMIQFVIIAIVIFLMVKALTSLRRREAAAPEAPPAPTRTEILLMEIRDLLGTTSIETTPKGSPP
jgi:large conductance mechanosensitive channel